MIAIDTLYHCTGGRRQQQGVELSFDGEFDAYFAMDFLTYEGVTAAYCLDAPTLYPAGSTVCIADKARSTCANRNRLEKV